MLIIQPILNSYSVQEIYSTDGYVNFDITHAVQNHYSSGATTPLAIIIQAEENLSVVNGRMNFYSSDYNDWEYRPSLNVTYEMTNAWIDSAPTNLTPVDGSTMWNLSAPRPSGAESVTASWTPSSANNETGFYACFAKDARMTTDLECVDTNDAASLLDVNAVWDAMNYSLIGTDVEGEDAWVYWSLYSYQEVMTGNNYIRHGDRTDPIKFRIPEDQGSDDGNGNHTVTLSAGSIFEETSPLPAAPDVHVLSSSTTTNFVAQQSCHLALHQVENLKSILNSTLTALVAICNDSNFYGLEDVQSKRSRNCFYNNICTRLLKFLGIQCYLE